ncbi:MAG: FecR family protein [Chloroflexota bacterium]|nr:FecR family protein [Chloroflexota bacterium]
MRGTRYLAILGSLIAVIVTISACDVFNTPTPSPGPVVTPTVGMVDSSVRGGGTVCRGVDDKDCVAIDGAVLPAAPSYDRDLIRAAPTGSVRLTTGGTRLRLLDGGQVRVQRDTGLGITFLLEASYALFDHFNSNSAGEIEVRVGEGTPPKIRIQPVGTRFSVGLDASGSVQVAVISGSVVITSTAGAGYTLTLPDALQHSQVRFDPQGVLGTPYPLDADTRRIWRYYGGGPGLDVASEITDVGNCPPDRVALPGLDAVTRVRLGCPVEAAHTVRWTAATAQRFQSGSLYYDGEQATLYAIYIPSGGMQKRGWESSSLPALPATRLGAARPDLAALLGEPLDPCADLWTIQRFAGGTVIVAGTGCVDAVGGGAILYTGGLWEPLPAGSVPPPVASATRTVSPPRIVQATVAPNPVRYGPCGDGAGTILVQATLVGAASGGGVHIRFRRSAGNDPAGDLIVPLVGSPDQPYAAQVSADSLAFTFLGSGSGSVAYLLEATDPNGAVVATQGGTLQVLRYATPTVSPTATPTSSPTVTVTATATTFPSATATTTRTATATVTATRSPTRTATPTATPRPTRSPLPTRTPTRTATTAPTYTPTATPTPDRGGPQIGNVSAQPHPLDYSSCPGHIFTVQANASDPSGVKGVSLTYRYHSTDSRLQVGPWRTVALTEIKAGLFRTQIDISQKSEAPADMVVTVPGGAKPSYTSGTLDYYLSATDTRGNRANNQTAPVSLIYGSCVIPLQ